MHWLRICVSSDFSFSSQAIVQATHCWTEVVMTLDYGTIFQLLLICIHDEVDI